MEASAAAPRVAVVVVSYNAGDYLGRCIAALRRQGYADFEVIIADNASSDGCLDRLGPLPEKFRLLRLPTNLGFAAANNRAIAATRAAWIATLNPDAFPAPDWLEQLMAAASRHPDACMFGSTQIDAGDPERLDGTGDVYHAVGLAWRMNHGAPIGRRPPEGEVFSPCAAAALYRRDAIDAAGGFDERFFCYCEDVDLGFRLRLAGGRCIQVAAARVEHVGSGSTGRDSEFAIYHGTRNLVWTLLKDTPGPLLAIMLPLHLVAQACRLALAVGSGRAAPMLRGIAAGFASLGPVLVERRRVQSRRRASTTAIARALTWSPMALVERLGARMPEILERGKR